MIGTTLALLSAFACGALSYVLITFLKKKSPGMQALHDRFLINIMYANLVFVWFYAILYNVKYFYAAPFHPTLAKILLHIYVAVTINVGISLTYVPLVRYMSIFHSTMINTIDEDVLVRNCQVFSLVLSIFLTVIDIFIIREPYDEMQDYAILTGAPTHLLSHFNKTVEFVFSFSGLGFIMLQIRIEIANYKYSEGVVYNLKTKWNKRNNQSNQSDIENQVNTENENQVNTENNDHSLLFQRIFFFAMMIMCLIFLVGEDLSPNTDVPFAVLFQIMCVNFMYFAFCMENPQCRKYIKTDFYWIIE